MARRTVAVSTCVALAAALTGGAACDPPETSDPNALLGALKGALLLFPEPRLDGVLDGLEGRTYKLALRRRDPGDPDRPGGLDPLASTLHLQLLGHAPGDTSSAPDATAVVPRLCTEIANTLQQLGNVIAPTALGRALVALAICKGIDRPLDAVLGAGSDLDGFLEREVAPAMKGSRGGDCGGYTIEAANLEFKVTGVDLVPNGAETKLTMRIEDPVLAVTDGTYQVRKTGAAYCVDRSLVGARLAIKGRLDLGFRARAGDVTDRFPWPEACGKTLEPYMTPPAEAATVPRDLLHGRLTFEVDTRATIDKFELDSQGLTVDWAVKYFLNHTKRIRCAIAGVPKAECTRDTEAARTLAIGSYDALLPAWGAVLQNLRWSALGGQQVLAFDHRTGLDPDHDQKLTGLDNCPNLANPDQQDTDYDGVGDPCDPVAGDPKVYMTAILQQQVMYCGLGTLSDTLDPRKVYPQISRSLGDPMVQGIKKYWQMQAKDYGFDWSLVVIDEDPQRLFATRDQALEVTRFNLGVLADRWKIPSLRQLPLRVGPAKRVEIDPAAKLPPLTAYQRAVLELALPDRLVP